MAGKGNVFLLLLLLCQTLVYAQIKHVIVLMEENRSFDHFFGWFPGADGLTGNEYNLVNQSNPKSERIYVSKANNDVAQCDPDHSISGTTAKIFGVPASEANNLTDPNMSGFVEWESMRGNTGTDYCAVMASFTPEDLPIMSTLASEFVLMDRFFCAVPGPTWPNRLFMLSATSMGLTETGEWYQNQEGQLFPQPTIFDQVAGAGMTWKHYFNDTPWELFLSSVVHHPENVQSMEQFYLDAATGNLPNFAWMNPRAGVNMSTGLGSNDDHPDHDVALGEQYYKDIYEAIRASPQWNETLFIITFDEHGGFYDHVPPPMNVPPPGDNTPTYPDKGVEWDRLGVRIPTLLISPWVPKGLILSEPPAAQKPESNSEYTLTSIMATARKVLGINSGPLNKRDAWSATFEQVLSEATPRTDCPTHLPDAPPPHQITSAAQEAKLPLNGLQKDIMKFHANMMGEEMPDHVVVQGQFSEWAQNKFFTHKHHHMKWKESKLNSEFSLIVQAGALFQSNEIDWNLNKASGVSFNTLSVNNNTLCLDYNMDNLTVGVTPCYPSYNPSTNRDPSQQWVWGIDAFIRPNVNASLCLTTHYPEGDPHMYLEPCDIENVQQHFAWQGQTNMGYGSGPINWGPFSLGILSQ